MALSSGYSSAKICIPTNETTLTTTTLCTTTAKAIRGRRGTLANGGSTICYDKSEVLDLVASSQNHDELVAVWAAWFDTAVAYKELYPNVVDLANKAAVSKGYQDACEDWFAELGIDNLKELVDSLYLQIKPLYEQLHAYVRRALRNEYGADKFKSRKIPIQLLGL
jgi:peptidyl-dipeptidase A